MKTIKQIIADFWHALEVEGHDIPLSIHLAPATFDHLEKECIASGGSTGFTQLHLTHGSKSVLVVRSLAERSTPLHGQDPEKGKSVMGQFSKNHYVTFASPGTLFPETSTKPIAAWDPKLAVAIAESISERYGAKPYGFYFKTLLESEPIKVAGEEMRVEPKLLQQSDFHFLGGKVETVEEVEARNDPNEAILRSNMRGNDTPLVVVNTNSFRSTLPFEEPHVIVDATGAIVERGNDPKWIAYRERIASQKNPV